MELLDERIETVYKKHPGYSDKATTVFNLQILPPQDLPDPLKGEQWTFVQLSVFKLEKEIRDFFGGKTIGSSFVFNRVLKKIEPNKLIPGIAVYSRRSVPLSAWTSSLELASLTADVKMACLILETGLEQRWKYGSYRRSNTADQEARAWERAKKLVNGLHFLVIQSTPDSEAIAGLWLMQERSPPYI
jgi:hypothetical protein